MLRRVLVVAAEVERPPAAAQMEADVLGPFTVPGRQELHGRPAVPARVELHDQQSSKAMLTEVIERGIDFERVAYQTVP